MSRFIGGPLDGRDIETSAHVVELAGHEYAYHRTNAPEWQEPDPDWWMKGLPEPEPPEKVYEWHPRDWEPPAVAWIKAAVREAPSRSDPPAMTEDRVPTTEAGKDLLNHLSFDGHAFVHYAAWIARIEDEARLGSAAPQRASCRTAWCQLPSDHQGNCEGDQ